MLLDKFFVLNTFQKKKNWQIFHPLFCPENSSLPARAGASGLCLQRCSRGDCVDFSRNAKT